jgi:hypothetical protein
MKRGLALVMLLVVCSAASAAGPGFRWPLPKGWNKETIPFPLSFAPQLKYQGTEELRFAPGFFDPQSPGYWSYGFVWWLDGKPELNEKTLNESLPAYFTGLCKAAAAKSLKLDPSGIKVALTAAPNEVLRETTTPESQFDPKDPQVKELLKVKIPPHRERLYRGEVDTYDPFVSGKPLKLYCEIEVWDCDASKRRIVLALLSPKPRPDPVWRDLDERSDEFLCH